MLEPICKLPRLQNSSLRLSYPLTVLFIHSPIQPFICATKFCWMPINTGSGIWWTLNRQFIYFDFKNTLFAMWKMSWKNVSRRTVSVIIWKNYLSYHIRINSWLHLLQICLWFMNVGYCTHRLIYHKTYTIKEKKKILWSLKIFFFLSCYFLL